jgi:hypothetical protein
MVSAPVSESDAVKASIVKHVQDTYLKLRKGSADHVLTQLSGDFNQIRKAYDELNGAYALLDALTYLSIQFTHENDPIFMERLAKLDPNRVMKQIRDVRDSADAVWNPKWNGDPFLLREVFAGGLQEPDGEAGITKEVRTKITNVLANKPIIGLRSVYEMQKSIDVVERQFTPPPKDDKKKPWWKLGKDPAPLVSAKKK